MLSDVELLKMGLMTDGMAVSAAARKAIEGDEKRPLTLAEYASTSGVSMRLENNIWVNAPIPEYNPNFVCREPPYILDYIDGLFVVRNGGREYRAKPIPVPAYYNQSSSDGERFIAYGVTHTDRVRISPIAGCVNACQFCDLPNIPYRKKKPETLVECIRVALGDNLQKAKHILISGGTPRTDDYDYENGVYETVTRAFPGIPIDIMMTPMPGLLDAGRLKKIGINGLSINLELYNSDLAQKIMPRKWKISRQRYLDFIEKAVELFGEGKVRSLLMVGLEPIEDTLRGVEALAQRGCDPILSPFRPDPSTPMKDARPPPKEFLGEVYQRSLEIINRFPRVKLGPRCIPCMHNTLTFPDNSGAYYCS